MRIKLTVKHVEIVVRFYTGMRSGMRSYLTQAGYSALSEARCRSHLVEKSEICGVWAGLPAQTPQISPLLKGTTWAVSHGGRLTC